MEEFEKALKYNSNDYQAYDALLQSKKWIEHSIKTGDLLIGFNYRFAIAFWRVGKHKEAEYYFNQDIKYAEGSIKLGRSDAEWGGSYYGLAAIYSFLGDKAKAYKYLEGVNKLNTYPLFWVVLMRHDPCFKEL